jgi:GTPase
VILFLVDGQTGVTPADHEIAEILRRKQRVIDGKFYPPVILVVNKGESAKIRQVTAEFYELGMGEPYSVSAMHGTGTGDLLDEVIRHIEAIGEDTEEDTSAKIAIVGKPNVGKSSLLNKIIGEERALVSDIPGTTRDAVDTKLDYEGFPVTLIDTAGIRRRGKVEPGVEKYSVIRSMNAIERADVAILVIDATTSITAQDTHIAGYIKDAWKSAIVAVNKWDLVEKDTYTINDYTAHIRQELNFVDYVPLIFISALTGKRVDQVFPSPCACRRSAWCACPHRRSTASSSAPRTSIPPLPSPAARCGSITAPRCAVTRRPLCCMSITPNMPILATCAILKTNSGKTTLYRDADPDRPKSTARLTFH